MASHDGVKRRVAGVPGSLDQIVSVLRAAPDPASATYAARACTVLSAFPPARAVLLAAGAHTTAAATGQRLSAHPNVVRACSACVSAVTWVP
jgi:hypothetical protein